MKAFSHKKIQSDGDVLLSQKERIKSEKYNSLHDLQEALEVWTKQNEQNISKRKAMLLHKEENKNKIRAILHSSSQHSQINSSYLNFFVTKKELFEQIISQFAFSSSHSFKIQLELGIFLSFYFVLIIFLKHLEYLFVYQMIQIKMNYAL